MTFKNIFKTLVLSITLMMANTLWAAESTMLSDTSITAKVKASYMQEKLFGDKDIAAMTIKVETNGGVVTLTGTADSQAQADNAVKIAKSISGVTEVKSSVKVVPNQ